MVLFFYKLLIPFFIKRGRGGRDGTNYPQTKLPSQTYMVEAIQIILLIYLNLIIFNTLFINPEMLPFSDGSEK